MEVFKANFAALYQTIQLDDAGTWSEFNKSSHSEQAIPDVVAKKTTPFQQMIVVQALKPDRLHSAMNAFAERGLGTKLILRCWMAPVVKIEWFQFRTKGPKTSTTGFKTFV